MNSLISASTNKKINKLKEHLENLFPGQWITNNQRTRTISTGLAFIDQNISRGLARQRINAWTGPASCGKTSLLRSIIKRWLNCGLEIAYIDIDNKLTAGNWTDLNTAEKKDDINSGNFRVIRNLPNKDQLWAIETLIYSRIFDVIILDLNLYNQNNNNSTKDLMSWRTNKTYWRLQSALNKSQTALLLLTDNDCLPDWNFYARLNFQWGLNIQFIDDLQGKALILPTVDCSITKDGLSRQAEVEITADIPNHLFTHAPIPDRRSAEV